MTELKPCPFCGAKPDFPEAKDVYGTCYDFGCRNCGMVDLSWQIIDCFEHPRDEVHESWDDEKIQYGYQYIEEVRSQAIAAWNQRKGEDE